MEQTLLKALARSENPKKTRTAGFIPGVLNGAGAEASSVKFESAALNKIITKHGTNAKMWVEFNDEKKFGFIKEIQKHPVEAKVIHITIQLVGKDQEVKMHLPITFHGREELEHKLMQIQVYKTDVEVIGKTELMPDVVVVDIAQKESGDLITAADFHLPEGIRILDAENEHYAIIKAAAEEIEEEPAVVK